MHRNSIRNRADIITYDPLCTTSALNSIISSLLEWPSYFFAFREIGARIHKKLKVSDPSNRLLKQLSNFFAFREIGAKMHKKLEVDDPSNILFTIEKHASSIVGKVSITSSKNITFNSSAY